MLFSSKEGWLFEHIEDVADESKIFSIGNAIEVIDTEVERNTTNIAGTLEKIEINEARIDLQQRKIVGQRADIAKLYKHVLRLHTTVDTLTK